MFDVIVRSFFLLTLFLGTAGASTHPDVLPEGAKGVSLSCYVDSSRVAADYAFVYTSFDLEPHLLDESTPVDGHYYFKLHAIPREELPGFEVAQQKGSEALRAWLDIHAVATSERISTRETVPEYDPTEAIVRRYEVVRVENDVVVVEPSETRLDAEGETLSPNVAEERRISIAAIALLGMIGLALLLFLRRKHDVVSD